MYGHNSMTAFKHYQMVVPDYINKLNKSTCFNKFDFLF